VAWRPAILLPEYFCESKEDDAPPSIFLQLQHFHGQPTVFLKQGDWIKKMIDWLKNKSVKKNTRSITGPMKDVEVLKRRSRRRCLLLRFDTRFCCSL
jgi:hypothetical protein